MPQTSKKPNATVWTHRQPLPAGYRLREVLAFHQRDAQQMSEWVVCTAAGAPVLHKAMDWQGQPSWLTLEWQPPEGHGTEPAVQDAALAAQAWSEPVSPGWTVEARLHIPAGGSALQPERVLPQWAGTVRRMLGLAYPPQALEAHHRHHPQLGALLQRQQGLHVPAAPTVWEALTWAITGQQITVAAAVTLRRRLIASASVPLQAPSGLMDGRVGGLAAGAQWPGPAALWVYPNAQRVAALGEAGLRSAGYSQAKTQALLTLAQQVCAGDLPLQHWEQASAAGTWTAADAEDVAQALLAVPGVGPWTVHYTLLRGLGWPDGSLHGDVAVRKALAQLQGVERVTEAQARDWLAPLAPWRALVAAHLWASLSAKAY